MTAPSYLPGQRGNFPALTVTQVTFYEAQVYREETITKHRYAFVDAKGQRFVYTGRHFAFRVNDVVNIRATIKKSLDQYGYVRLCRIRTYEPQPELEL